MLLKIEKGRGKDCKMAQEKTSKQQFSYDVALASGDSLGNGFS